MPTLLELPEPAAVAGPVLDEAPVEAFDLETLALLSAPPAIEPPKFALLESAPRFRLRRMMVTGLLAALTVAMLGTLRPAVQGTQVSPSAAQTGTANAACPLD